MTKCLIVQTGSKSFWSLEHFHISPFNTTITPSIIFCTKIYISKIKLYFAWPMKDFCCFLLPDCGPYKPSWGKKGWGVAGVHCASFVLTQGCLYIMHSL
uniref:Uncharacterized protein n=1 Tax=Anguilla anguilla TaxID=7936 RepID=A0A0E9X5H7_ANGAN